MTGKGFRFGMLLQLAVGPMCLLVFNTAVNQGFWRALSLVSAIALMDALFIFLSGAGISAVLNRPGIQRIIQIFGACVLILFGLNMSLSAWNLSLLPQIRFLGGVTTKFVFWQGIFLTASNPLTILFWSGVFSAQMLEHGYSRQEMLRFGIGCVLSTVTFLSIVAAVGFFAGSFISVKLMRFLNVCVGLVLVCFGCRLAVKKG